MRLYTIYNNRTGRVSEIWADSFGEALFIRGWYVEFTTLLNVKKLTGTDDGYLQQQTYPVSVGV